MVCYTEVLDYNAGMGYCTIMVLCNVVKGYTAVVLETVVNYTVVVLQIAARDCTVAVAQFYILVVVQIFLLHVQPEPYMYLQSFLSSSPKFYIPCLRVQLTYKSCNMYSSELSGISTSRGNDRDHAHVFCKSHTMVLMGPKGLAYPLQYTVKIMETHSCGDLFSYTLYTKHLLFSPFLCSDLIGMFSSSDIASNIPCFPLTVRLPAGPHPEFGISVVSKDT
jgi:hypothetical protein